jgi:hypothetical protein
MDPRRDSAVSHSAKVLEFPKPAQNAGSAHGIRANGPAAVERWSTGGWLVLAWFLAASRVHLAAVHHEVFGLEAHVAFLLAVVMPLMRARKLFELIADAARAFRGRREHD